MQPHQQRVVVEKEELNTKLNALSEFVETARFDGLPDAERLRMIRQKSCMLEYSKVLGERIDAFQ